MSWPQETRKQLHQLNMVISDLDSLFVGRSQAIRLLALATLCREHLLLIGPPGTAKTQLIQRFSQMVDAKGFHYLLSRFSEPAELFGPPDMQAFKQGRWHTNTVGMLPEAEIAFLDEVFLGSSAILNALLSLAAERLFHNGAELQRCPLWTIVGASNQLPDDPSLEAFADRFSLRILVQPLENHQLDALLERGWLGESQRCKHPDQEPLILPTLDRADLLALQRRVGEVNIAQVRGAYGQLVGQLRSEGIAISDRRAVHGLKLIAGAALLRGETRAGLEDFWPIRHLWQRSEQAAATAVCVDQLLTEGGALLQKHRPLHEILQELEILASGEERLAGEVALGAHLMPLNGLRQEILLNHGGQAEALAAVEGAIERILQRLEAAYV